ncbi:MAG: hypothetical protein FJY98_04805 [Candidatus Liptonbacteria bacterium]|nr:hypothetical protein [Candidatus Liptonbacteria bacterium]
MEKHHIWGWVLGGIVVALLLIYFAVSNGVLSPLTEKLGITTAEPAKRSNAPAGISYDQTDLYSTSSVVTGAPELPGQSLPITETQIPKSAIKLSVERSGFTPASFTVQRNQTVVVSLTSPGNRSHTFLFDDPSLSAVAVGVAPGETRVITFTAPAKAGNYTFRSNVPGDAAVGTMIVK